MKVFQVSVDVVISDDRTIKDIENGVKDLAEKNGYAVVDSNSTDVSDYYNDYDPSDHELQRWCVEEYYDGLCDICPHVMECNNYIAKHGKSPLDTYGEQEV